MDAPGLPTTIITSAQICAKRFGLPLQLVLAIIKVESGGDAHAWNPEPPYRYLWDVRAKRPFRALTAAEIASEKPPADFASMKGDADAEWWGQAASWGPMQIMGAVARELGFDQHFPALCDTYLGIEYGCRHLAALMGRFGGRGLPAVAAAYNAGSPRLASSGAFVNQVYVDKVAGFGGFKRA